MKRVLTLLVFLYFHSYSAKCQDTDLGVYYGRFWSPFKYIDYGTGFRNQSSSNYNFFPSVALNKYYKPRTSAELCILFTNYQQYFSTRTQFGPYNSSHIVFHLVGRVGYSIVKKSKFETGVKGGIGLGITGLEKWEFTSILTYPVVDSIARGTDKKNYTPLFPMLSFGIDFSYKLSKRIRLSLASNYQKGFLKISEFDIYYNDGSGYNDQRAKQWGTGDFWGLQLGLRYLLKNENERKTDRKTTN